MLKRTSALFLVLLAVGAGAASVAAKPAGKKHSVSATVQLGTITSDSNFPAVGSGVTDAGIVRSRPGGSGAETDALKVTAAPAPGQLTLVGTAKLWFTAGTQTAKVTIQATVAPDGSVSYTGGGTFTRGTGKYKGITGKLTFTGSSPANTGIVTLTVKGSARY
jgi:hypothetical protein